MALEREHSVELPADLGSVGVLEHQPRVRRLFERLIGRTSAVAYAEADERWEQ